MPVDFFNVVYPGEALPRRIPASEKARAKVQGARLATDEEMGAAFDKNDAGSPLDAFTSNAAKFLSGGLTRKLEKGAEKHEGGDGSHIDRTIADSPIAATLGTATGGTLALLAPLPKVLGGGSLSSKATAVGEKVAGKVLGRTGSKVASKVAGLGIAGGIENAEFSALDALSDDKTAPELFMAGLEGFGIGAVANPALHGVLKGLAATAKVAKKAGAGALAAGGKLVSKAAPKVEGAVEVSAEVAKMTPAQARAAKAAEEATLKDTHVAAKKAAKAEHTAAVDEAKVEFAKAQDAAQAQAEVKHAADRAAAAETLHAEAKAYQEAHNAVGENGEPFYRGHSSKLKGGTGPATKGSAVTTGSDTKLRNLLDLPAHRLAKNSDQFLLQLEKQNGGLKKMLNEEASRFVDNDAINGARAALERNEALIEKFKAFEAIPKKGVADRIADVASPRMKAAEERLVALEERPGSQRLAELDQHILNLADKPKLGILGTAAAGAAGIKGYGLAAAVVGPGMLAAAGGSLAYKLAADVLRGEHGGVFRDLLTNIGKGTAKHKASLEGLLDAAVGKGKPGGKVTSGVLKDVSYSPEAPKVGSKTAPMGKGNGRRDDFHRIARELRASVGPVGPTAPGLAPKLGLLPAARRAVRDQLHGLRLLAPKLADATELALERKLVFLYQRLPARPPQGIRIGPDTWQPSNEQIATVERSVAAAEGGLPHALQLMAAGKLTPDAVKALKVVHPQTFAMIQTGLVRRLGELRATLPYATRLMLSILFEVPVDASLDPIMCRELQNLYPPPEPTPTSTPATPANLNLNAAGAATTAQRVSQ